MARSSAEKGRLSDEDIDTIVAVIEVWEGPLTWSHLVAKVALVLGRTYSRQALDGHDRIKAAYQAKKRRNRVIRESLKRGKALSEEMPADLVEALRRSEAAELRVQALEQIIDSYRQKFVVWLYNARNAGISEEQLNNPLPNTDQTAGALWSKRKAKK